jgi:hypothetical protein
MGGLSVATFLTLFLLPSIYALWNRNSLGPEKFGARARCARADGARLGDARGVADHMRPQIAGQ